MTNGETIKTIFPNEEMYEQTPTMTYYGMMRFDTDWWNAEYTEPTIESGISNKSIIYKAKKSKEIQEDLDKLSKLNESTTKSETLVSLDVYKQVAKERDIAIEQLHELGYEFGQKIEPTNKNNLVHNLCDSCTNIGCEFQSGIVRTKCAFYMPPQLEPDNCGNYAVQAPTTKNNLGVDCISRQAALKIHDEWFATCNIADKKESPKAKIKALPSVTLQEPRKGHWIRVDKDKLRCSECDVIHFIAQYPQGKIEWCPNCGSRNEVKDGNKRNQKTNCHR